MAENLLTKICKECSIEKSLDDFPKNRLSKCKICDNKQRKIARDKRNEKKKELENLKPKNPDNKICIDCKEEKCLNKFKENENKCLDCIETKICFLCNERKLIREFVVGRNKCKVCANQRQKELRDEKAVEKEKEKKVEKENSIRKCGKCSIEKSLTSYRGNYKVCEECRNKDKVKEELPTSKKCTSCDIEKLLDEFPVGRNKCKICYNKQKNDSKKLRNAKKKEEKEALLPQPKVEGNKICIQCNEEKAKDMFRDNRNKCKECEKADGRAYRQSEKGKQKSKEWVEQNQDRMVELQSNWYQNNKEKINEKYVEKYHNDKDFNFRAKLKSKISDLIKKNSIKLTKYDYFINEIGCNKNFYLDWIEHCFEDDMNLQNHGKLYDIDHVIPIGYFKKYYENDMDICFSWFNTMPLYKKDNMKKKENIDINQIKKHLENLVKFDFIETDQYKKYLDLIESIYLSSH